MSGNVELEKTLAIIKPDAVQDADEIKRIIKASGFAVIAERKIHLSTEQAGDFYAEHYGKMFFTNLMSFMSGGPIIAIVLAKKNSIEDWRKLMGPTNPMDARERFPDSIRALFGKDQTQNSVHGSDSVASASREIRFFFPQMILEPIPTGQTTERYIEQHITPTLNEALCKLCKEKPGDPVSWLAEYLDMNNPNKPCVTQP